MSEGHVHAALMAEYAKDAATSETPWEFWESAPPRSLDFEALQGHPSWVPVCQYRRKPRTIMVNGIEVPEPAREAPERGAEFYIASTLTSILGEESRWGAYSYQFRWLKHGLIHLTREAAEAHARAMIAPSFLKES